MKITILSVFCNSIITCAMSSGCRRFSHAVWYESQRIGRRVRLVKAVAGEFFHQGRKYVRRQITWAMAVLAGAP